MDSSSFASTEGGARNTSNEFKKAFSFEEEEESEWNSSKIKGFTFNDDDNETPFQDFEHYKNTSILSNVTSSGSHKGKSVEDEFVISFDFGQSGPVSDRVKHAAACSRFQNNSVHQTTVINAYENPIPTDPKKLENEVRYLRRQAEKLKNSRYFPLHPKDTIKDILFDREYSFEFYKTFDLKKELLDAALDIGDGNAILAVVLFLRKTLNDQKLTEILLTRPVAVNHLVAYLESRNMFNDLAHLHSSLGNYEDNSFAEYKKIILESPSLEHKVKRLKIYLQNTFRPHQDIIIEHINLMDRIVAIHSTLKIPPVSDSNSMFQSVMNCDTTIRALRFMHYHFPNEHENLLHSPLGFLKTHKLSEKQNAWNGIYASASKQSWSAIRSFATSKSWLGGIKANASVNFERLVKILNEEFSAPSEELIFYLNYVEPIDDRLNLALKIKAHTVVCDCYVNMKDRSSLTKYRDSLVLQSCEWLYADNALNSGSTKWKN
ncbi:spermatogenesis-defective protein 39 homolog [Lepeophtheirus salmonis]|uniref:spermatogenesis-defective protein 39 homolog n=1 Tax=Lepeophtheirus salmonis TaxID=72036 RepID=UPI001AE74B4F|nr:spermatogenesis-defective protein 39 homolog [Lepeophtheirus salmonis]